MRLKAVTIENFRGYRSQTRIPIGDLTAFIGRNDAGKSTILEALAIFFESGAVKLDLDDLCKSTTESVVRIGCVFDDLPSSVIIDSDAETSLADEYLLNSDGDFEVIQEFDMSRSTPKASAFAIALHPSKTAADSLLLKKNQELKSLYAEMLSPSDDIDKRSNVALRRAICEGRQPLELSTVKLPLDKDGARDVWEATKHLLPLFALFRSDRPSNDADAEIQDPLKFAVKEAIHEVQSDLKRIEEAVHERATQVANRTLAKLKNIDPSLASQLSPKLRSDLKWESLFKLSLDGDDSIPINKRGSGVRRLILLSFFQAEAERRQLENSSPGVIYAIEEPETSQHPSNQKLIVEVLRSLGNQANTQVILTTHVPGLAGLLPAESIRHVSKAESKDVSVACGDDAVLRMVADDLGVLPDANNRVSVLCCVEGPHDVEFLNTASEKFHQQDSTIINLATDERVALMPLGGSTLKQWVEKNYLEGLGLLEAHLYDGGLDKPPKYHDACEQINTRDDRSFARLTQKNELENYLHPDAIARCLGVEVKCDAQDDVPMLVAKAIHEQSESSVKWECLSKEQRKHKESNVKKRLNGEVVVSMTVEQFDDMDPDREIRSWLTEVASLLA